MIFLLSGALFSSTQVKHSDLLALLRGAALRGHSLLVVDNPFGSSSNESQEFDSWVKRLSNELQQEVAWLRERVRRIAPNAVTRGAKTIAVIESTVTSEATQRVGLNLTEAIRLASLPLFVLVENSLSESAFIRRVMPSSWRKKLREWEITGAVRFEHGGGIGEMKRIVEHCSVEGSMADPLGLGASAWRASHFLLCDRDSQAQDGKQSKESRDLQRACNKAKMGGQLHVLRRRDQEAYLPEEALRAIVHTKTGKNECDDMLSKLDKHLAVGRGKHHLSLPKIGESSWFKNAFLEYEVSIVWEDEWFVRDGSGPEMVDLAEAIAAFL